MQKIRKASSISKTELFAEINKHLLNDEKPSGFINKISADPLFNEFPFNMLAKLKRTEQSPRHHPEGNAWNHTMMVLDEAARRKELSKNPTVFMWAALLHDIGKPCTTKIKKGRITSYDHDKAGAELAVKFLSEFNMDEDFIRSVADMVRWHMQILFVVRDLPFADISSMKSETDINEMALLGMCDRLGREGANFGEERENIRLFIKKCNAHNS